MRVARRYGSMSRDVVDDLVQDTYAKLWEDDRRTLRSFEALHGGTFLGFVKVIAANVAHDYFKRELTAKRGGRSRTDWTGVDAATVAASSTSFGSPEASETGILRRELDALLTEVADGALLERDRRIFWLYYRVGLTAEAISRLRAIGLGVKGVESTLLRLSRLLRARLASSSRASRNGIEGDLEGIQAEKSF
jgi:RNA polymerase sigma factor (sigma-70 family)